MSLYLFHKSASALLGAGSLESPRRWLTDGLLKDKVGCLGFEAKCIKGDTIVTAASHPSSVH